jgi:hypothetical protein
MYKINIREVQQSREKCILKVLPSEMDPAEIRLLR